MFAKIEGIEIGVHENTKEYDFREMVGEPKKHSIGVFSINSGNFVDQLNKRPKDFATIVLLRKISVL